MVADRVSEIQILLFIINGIKVGIDTEQIFEIIDLKQVKEYDCPVIDFLERVSFKNGLLEKEETYRILLVKPTEKELYGIKVVAPEEIMVVGVGEVRKLPPILKGKIDPDIFWAVFISNGEIILLADMFKLQGGN